MAQVLIPQQQLDFALAAKKPTLLQGYHGCGKTAMIEAAFAKAGYKQEDGSYVYFSCATLNPEIDFCGVPKEVNGRLQLIRRPFWDNVKAIFLDEYNRAPKRVRNATMELIQFGSLNGEKLPKLEVIWAAVNPADAKVEGRDVDYNVEQMDPAQLDRFWFKFEVPQKLCEPYLLKTHPTFAQEVKNLCYWYDAADLPMRLALTPRCVDRALWVLRNKGTIENVLPKECPVELFMKWMRDTPGSKTSANAQSFLIPGQTDVGSMLASFNGYVKRGLLAAAATAMVNMIPFLAKEEIRAIQSDEHTWLTYVPNVIIANSKTLLGRAMVELYFSNDSRALESLKDMCQGAALHDLYDTGDRPFVEELVRDPQVRKSLLELV